MDECERLRLDVLARKALQNERRVKKGLTPRHKLTPVPKAPPRSSMPPPPESGDEEDTAMSFTEWSVAGWAVKKGQKCSGFDILGVPQFLRSQVQRINPAWAAFRSRKK